MKHDWVNCEGEARLEDGKSYPYEACIKCDTVQVGHRYFKRISPTFEDMKEFEGKDLLHILKAIKVERDCSVTICREVLEL